MDRDTKTKAEHQAIIAFYLQPNSLRATCHKFGHSPKYISQLLKQYNITKHAKRVNCQPNKIAEKDIANIIKTYNETKSLTATKQRCNISIYRLKQLLKQNNIALPTLAEQAKNRADTCLSKYGTGCSLNNAKVKQKTMQTNLAKYGVEHSSKAESVKEKLKTTCLERYGVSSYTKTASFKEKAKQTNRKKYNADYFSQTNEFKNRIKNTNLAKYGKEYFTQTAKFKALSKETCLKKYGVPYSFQSKNNKEKALATKKRNGTLTTSKIEADFKDFLNQYNIEFKQQYKEARYPFHCDFYLPKFDLFIELNFNWTHGGKPYDSNSAIDKAIVQKWTDRAKKSKYYESALDVWTKRDPIKQHYALIKKLNYEVIYNKTELEKLKTILKHNI